MNEAAWAGAIFIFAWVALLAVRLRWRRHGLLWPMAIAAVGVAMIMFAVVIAYERIIEIIGFALLCAGTWRLGRR